MIATEGDSEPLQVAVLNEMESVLFGRDVGCRIRLGYSPAIHQAVPRMWGSFSWHQGRVYITVNDNAVGIEVSWADPLGAKPTVVRTVYPGDSLGVDSSDYTGVGRLHDGEYRFRVKVAPEYRPRRDSPSDPSWTKTLRLSQMQQDVGRALIAPLIAGGPRPATYEEIAKAVPCARSVVTEAIGDMLSDFVLHGMAAPPVGRDGPDRVAHVLRTNPRLLGA